MQPKAIKIDDTLMSNLKKCIDELARRLGRQEYRINALLDLIRSGIDMESRNRELMRKGPNTTFTFWASNAAKKIEELGL